MSKIESRDFETRIDFVTYEISYPFEKHVDGDDHGDGDPAWQGAAQKSDLGWSKHNDSRILARRSAFLSPPFLSRCININKSFKVMIEQGLKDQATLGASSSFVMQAESNSDVSEEKKFDKAK